MLVDVKTRNGFLKSVPVVNHSVNDSVVFLKLKLLECAGVLKTIAHVVIVVRPNSDGGGGTWHDASVCLMPATSVSDHSGIGLLHRD